MKGFITLEKINDFTFDECVEFLEQYDCRSNPLCGDVEERRNQLLSKLFYEDDGKFKSCNKIKDFEYYLKSYPKPSPNSRYKPLHVEEAKKRIDEIKEERRRRRKRRIWTVIHILILILILILYVWV